MRILLLISFLLIPNYLWASPVEAQLKKSYEQIKKQTSKKAKWNRYKKELAKIRKMNPQKATEDLLQWKVFIDVAGYFTPRKCEQTKSKIKLDYYPTTDFMGAPPYILPTVAIVDEICD